MTKNTSHSAPLSSAGLHAPIAKKVPHLLETHGHQRNDNYYWMRDDERKDPEILAHLNAENSYCEAVMAPQQARQDALFKELKSRIVKDDSSVPCKDGDYWYHSEISGEQEYSRYYRATSFDGDNKHLLLDVNALAEPHEFFDLGDLSVSPNDRFLSYSQDTDSRRIYTIKFKDLNTGHYLDDELENTEGQLIWANDNQTVFYVKKDLQTLLGTQVFRHKLGTKQVDDELVYEEEDHSFYLSLSNSRDESLLMINLHATETTDCWALDANIPDGEFVQLIEFHEEHEYLVDKLDDTFYILTNWQAKNFRLMSANKDTLFDREQWQQVIAHRDNVLLEDIELFNQYFVITERELGQIRFIVHQYTGESFPLTFNDPCYDAALGDNPERDARAIRLSYSSLTTPATLFECQLDNGDKTTLKQQQVLGDFNSNNYSSERIFITARDGEQVPVSIVYRNDLFNKDGSNPLLQYGYGAYGIIIDPRFSSDNLSLLDRGFVYAIAHVRGGEMLGRHWYEQGKKQHKQNTFNDFIDVSKALIAQGYTQSDRLFASGGSAGGLLMGAVINQAPELYCGIEAQVPFVDVVTTMLDESIPLTTNEYDEWGNPNQQDAYQTMLAYSPVDNVAKQDYPHLLVITGLHDSQVQYFEPMKWVAKLREYKSDDNLLLFKTDMDAGHGGASGRFKRLKEQALVFTFLLSLAEQATANPT
ncbi:S9 family peptidase [Psychrobium sp. 1_MG-2023]|uniref:S9 family peptidase n=1 Tax=Psychrobium sp. 1_MG-2023 TaxID=3062624 RepID=UPI000C334BA2|nr:S9 family peptidase [Psychrobium sp. 1_MG-2023]MDP2559772.1 S9 family peptidase [Psychrobium sp. 1_MG-2023]PKF59120.1 oligopeptidase B [Alteromonadales bacterium alter-6D02]